MLRGARAWTECSQYWMPTECLGIQLAFSPSPDPFSSVQFSSVQFNSVPFSSIQFRSVQFSSVQFSSVQSCSRVLSLGREYSICNCNIKGRHFASSVADCCWADIHPVPRSSWDTTIAYQFQVVWSDSCNLDLRYISSSSLLGLRSICGEGRSSGRGGFALIAIGVS